AIFIFIYLFSSLIAEFYDSSELKDVLRVISFTFLIQPLGSQFSILLRKGLEFKSLAIRTIVSQVGSLLIGIFLARKGFEVYSLIYANLVSTFIGTVLLIIPGLKLHRPSVHFSINDIKPY